MEQGERRCVLFLALHYLTRGLLLYPAPNGYFQGEMCCKAELIITQRKQEREVKLFFNGKMLWSVCKKKLFYFENLKEKNEFHNTIHLFIEEEYIYL